MKTNWYFYFTSWGIAFPEEKRFDGNLQDEADPAFAVPFHVHLLPTEQMKRPGADGGGELCITLSGKPENTKTHAYIIANRIKDQLAFPNAKIELLEGISDAEPIPETQEEAENIGEPGHRISLSFQVKSPPVKFDSAQITTASVPHNIALLMRLYNQARTVTDPPKQYLAYFKIVEKQYAHGRGGSLAHALSKNKGFYQTVSMVVSPKESYDRSEFYKLVRRMIRTRDNCAHLRGKTGYLPGDQRIRTEVQPLLQILITLCEKTIAQGSQPEPPPSPNSAG